MKPERLLSGFAWSDTIWRQGELAAQVRGEGVGGLMLFTAILTQLMERCMELPVPALQLEPI